MTPLARLAVAVLSSSFVACGASSASGPGPDGGDASAPSRDASNQGRDADARASDASRPDQESGAPGPPTASSWIGTNVNADLPFADVTRLLNGFDTPPAQLDGNGYPVAGASGKSHTDLGFVLPSGTYDVSFVGSGSLAISGIGATTGPWKTVAGEQRNQVTLTGTPGSFGNFLDLDVTNGASQTVTAIHLYLPGIPYGAKEPFNPAFLAALRPFRALRFMEWQNINNSTLKDWAGHPTAAHFGASPYGQPYDLIVALINETGKDGWINVPELATPAFMTALADFMAKGLDFPRIAAARSAAGIASPFQLIVENSNETWNTSFTAYATFLAAANAASATYTGAYTGAYGPSWMAGNTSLMKVGQYEADRLVTIGKAFKAAFKTVGHESAIAPVLSGWALGAVYSDDGLEFIKAHYGAPKDYVSYVALAPYFATPDDSTTGSLTTLFPALAAAITSTDAAFKDFAALGKSYGIAIAAYEGGQGITGTTNQPVKHLAQFDQRMHDTYAQYFTFWKAHFGPSLFMHFDLAGDPGLPENIFQYGFWGSLPGIEEDLSTCGKGLPTLTGTETIASVTKYCPKYQALADRVPD